MMRNNRKKAHSCFYQTENDGSRQFQNLYGPNFIRIARGGPALYEKGVRV